MSVASLLHRRPDAPLPAPPRAVPDVVPAVRLGAVELRSSAPYLLVWTVVLLVVQLLVFIGAHAALDRLGVLASVSRAVATVLGEEVPSSGVLPELALPALLPWAALAAVALALLALLGALAVVLLHNSVCRLIGGPRVRTG